ncbi:acyltransferase [Lysobacter sp. KIS68-7]|uniref:acyltransferase n=1 Tax=Lysobacter sp. KIS68-7 TaxID=2904252 RepID=UPI001E42F58D|nr:acyltransferase [Lysobacter sp. KIS68-7]UHQ19919.1 acyltransferase [Lysobacter sp. KIS68-7]
MTSAHYTQEELREIGFAAWGGDVLVSRKASFYGAERIRLGDHVRIDDFCVLSAGEGGIDVGSRVHIAVYTSLIGKGRIEVRDFANLSSRVSIYSSNDDYSGRTMTNPMVPAEYTGVSHADVVIGRHVIVGSGSVVLPGVVLEEGVAVGALSLVRDSCAAFGIYTGTPAKRVGERSRQLLQLEAQLRSREGL